MLVRTAIAVMDYTFEKYWETLHPMHHDESKIEEKKVDLLSELLKAASRTEGLDEKHLVSHLCRHAVLFIGANWGIVIQTR
jgi:hypothetical protein